MTTPPLLQTWDFDTAEIVAMRFGYGVDGVRPNPTHKDDLIHHIKNPERFPPSVANRPPLAERVAIVRGYRDTISALRMEKAPAKQVKNIANTQKIYIRNTLVQDAHARFNAAVESRTPFFERLVFFWADHFSVSAKNNAVSMVAFDYEQTAIRPYVDGYFYDMLHAVIGHPAMLMFLDNHVSVGPNSRYIKNRKKSKTKKHYGLNENLGRELLELHTLGVRGGYTQADVTHTGQLLSGWSVDKKTYTFQFRSDFAEPNRTVIMGKTYGGSDVSITHMQDLLRDLSRHPKTAEFIALKLARHFISDNPPSHVVNHLATVFLNTDGHLPSVYMALLDTPEVWTTFGQKTKRPFDYLVSGIKATGYPLQELQPIKTKTGRLRNNPLSVGMLKSLNQILYHVSGPNGWSDMGQDWITPPGITYRLVWASRLAKRCFRKQGPLAQDRKNQKLYQATQACLGATPAQDALYLVQGAPTRQDALTLALSNPAFLRR